MPPKKKKEGFTTESGLRARYQQIFEESFADTQSLLQQIQRLKNENENLSQQIMVLKQNDIGKLISTDNVKQNNTILKTYLQMVQKNIKKQSKGYRYDGLKEFFTLLSFMGKNYYQILNDNLLFPTYKTCSAYKKEFLNKFGITEDILDGCSENVIKIMRKFLPNNFIGKGVMMIDAASVTPYVQIKEDGIVNGLLDIQKIDSNLAKYFIQNEDAFSEFIKEHRNYIIQAEFGITFAPLDHQYMQFPIGCFSATSGKASYEIVERIETLVEELNGILKGKLNIIGIGTDGDNSYNKYSNEFMSKLYIDFETLINLNAAEIVDRINVIMHFSDPFHLVKRDRYRKVSLQDFMISPYVWKQTRSSVDLEDIGIPCYLLDDNKGRKMEDDLPKKLFSMENIRKIININDFHLLIAMLPSTLLMESIHNKNLNRQATIDYLMFGASIVMIYFFMLKHITKNELTIYKIHSNTYMNKICFTEDWCKHYIFTTINIVSLLITEKNINLGACGSHYQEHNFANIRRHSKGDNSHVKFIKSMKYILLEKELRLRLNINENIPESRCDSGKSIFDDTKIEVRPIIYYLKLAKRLWRNITRFPRKSIISLVRRTVKKLTVEELYTLLDSFSQKKSSSISTKSTGMIKTAGLNNVTIWNAKTQLNDLIDDDD